MERDLLRRQPELTCLVGGPVPTPGHISTCHERGWHPKGQLARPRGGGGGVCRWGHRRPLQIGAAHIDRQAWWLVARACHGAGGGGAGTPPCLKILCGGLDTGTLVQLLHCSRAPCQFSVDEWPQDTSIDRAATVYLQVREVQHGAHDAVTEKPQEALQEQS
jgi:hypothetical protein